MANRKPTKISRDHPSSQYEALIDWSGASAKKLVKFAREMAMTPTSSLIVRWSISNRLGCGNMAHPFSNAVVTFDPCPVRTRTRPKGLYVQRRVCRNGRHSASVTDVWSLIPRQTRAGSHMVAFRCSAVTFFQACSAVSTPRARFEVASVGDCVAQTSVRQRCHSSPKRKRGTRMDRTNLFPHLCFG